MAKAEIHLKATADLVAIERTKAALSGLRNAVSGFDRVNGIVAGLTGGAVAAFASQVIGAADAIGDLSDQLQISTDDVQRLQILAGRTGVSFDKFAQALSRVGDARQKALGGDAAANGFFRRYGISGTMLTDQSQTTLDLLRQIGAVLAQGITANDQAALLDNLGKGADRLAGALSQIDSLGPVKLIDEADIKALGQAADTLDEVKRQLMVAAAPAIGWWGRALGRAGEIDAATGGDPFNFALTRGIWGEMWDDGPMSSDPISPGELQAARLRRLPLAMSKSKGDETLERRAAELEWGLLDSTERAKRLAATLAIVTQAMAGMADGPDKLKFHIAELEMRKELEALSKANSPAAGLLGSLSAPNIAGANRGMFQSMGTFNAWLGSVNYQKAAVDVLQRIERLLDSNNQLLRDGAV